MDDVKRYGLIGCGMMGQEHLRNIAILDGAAVAAIFEPDAGMAAASARIAPQARICGSVEALLAVEGLDALVIASPNDCHVAQMEEIARLRPLPLLVEKPLYVAAHEAERLDALMAAYPAPVWVAMEYRYMPPIAAFIAEAAEATGGIAMLSIREHRFPFLHKVGAWNRFNARTGGTLVEKCCHFFDLMRLILGSEPVRVMASAGQSVNHKSETIGGAVPDIWDNGYVVIDFASGARAMLELCMFAEGSEYQEELTALGPAGKIEARVPGPGRFWPVALGPAPVPQIIVSPREPKGPRRREIPVDPALLEAGDHNGATFYQHQRFLEVVRGKEAPQVGFRDGAVAVAVGLAAQMSASTGQAVSLPVPAEAPPARAVASAR